MPTLKLRDQYTPALYNTPEFVDQVVTNIEKSIGKENIFESKAVMGGEDFTEPRCVSSEFSLNNKNLGELGLRPHLLLLGPSGALQLLLL